MKIIPVIANRKRSIGPTLASHKGGSFSQQVQMSLNSNHIINAKLYF